jgi:acylphosphatase
MSLLTGGKLLSIEPVGYNPDAMEQQATKQLEAVVHGRVQGVSFRYYTRQEAQRLRVMGWVANQRDGTVRVIAQGSDSTISQFIDFLHRGPSMAHVDKVETKWVEVTKKFTRFSIRWL